MSLRKSPAARTPRVTGHARSDFGLWLIEQARELGIPSDRQLAVRLAQLRGARDVREGDAALDRAKARVARLMQQSEAPRRSAVLRTELRTIGIDCSQYRPLWDRSDVQVLNDDGRVLDILTRLSNRRLEFGEPPTLGIGELAWWSVPPNKLMRLAEPFVEVGGPPTLGTGQLTGRSVPDKSTFYVALVPPFVRKRRTSSR